MMGSGEDDEMKERKASTETVASQIQEKEREIKIPRNPSEHHVPHSLEPKRKRKRKRKNSIKAKMTQTHTKYSDTKEFSLCFPLLLHLLNQTRKVCEKTHWTKKITK